MVIGASVPVSPTKQNNTIMSTIKSQYEKEF